MKKTIIISGLLALAAAAVVLIVGCFLHIDGINDENRRVATLKSIEIIEQACHIYKEVTGEYPKSIEDLITPIGNFKKGVLKKGAVNDGWGTPIQFTRNEDSIEIRSAGPDKKMGTPDDLFTIFNTAAPVEPAAQP